MKVQKKKKNDLDFCGGVIRLSKIKVGVACGCCRGVK
jgi:hypothetical protein